MIRLVFQAALAVFLSHSSAQAESWPEFRGSTGQGLVLKGSLPVHWSVTRNVAWKQVIPGRGWSSPVVEASRVYLTTAVPDKKESKDQSLRPLCLDAVTGKILWNVEVFLQEGAKAPGIHGKNSHASPTPLIHGHHLYVHFGHQGTASLDLNGKVLWRNRELKYQPVHGNGGTPIIVDDLLVFSCDGGDDRFVVALDRNTGRIRWKSPRTGTVERKFSFSTPLLITVKHQKQIISPASNRVSAFEPATGKEIWSVDYSGYSVIPRPVYGHGLVYISTGYNRPSLLAIRPDGRGNVTETHVAWRATKGAPHTPSPLLVGDELYMVSDAGIATCLDARKGSVHWQERIEGNYSASPIFCNGRLYFQNELGTGVVLKAGKVFKILARNPLNERSLASCAAADEALFIRTEKHLYRIEKK